MKQKPFIMQAVFSAVAALGMLCYFCHSISFPNNVVVDGGIFIIFSLLTSIFINKKWWAKGSVFYAIILAVLLVFFHGQLQKDVAAICDYIAVRANIYFHLEGKTEPFAKSALDGQLLLILCGCLIILLLEVGIFCFRKISYGVVMALLVCGFCLIIGKSPRLFDAMLLVGGFVLLAAANQNVVAGRHQKAVLKKQGRIDKYMPVFVSALAVTLAVFAAVPFTRATKKSCFGQAKKVLNYEHQLEKNTTDYAIAAMEKMKDIFHFDNAGTMTNTKPNYSGKTICTITVSDQPQNKIYLRGFTGSIYKNGNWSNGSNSQFEKLVSSGSREAGLLQMDYSAIRNGAISNASLEKMKVSYSSGYHGKYGLIPYFSPSEELNGKSAERIQDLYYRRKPGRKTYSTTYYNMLQPYVSSMEKTDTLIKNNQEYDSGIYGDYIRYVQKTDCQLPENGLDKTRKLARYLKQSNTVKVNDDNVYYAIYSMRDFLQGITSYSLDLSAKPLGQDYVENFLFTQRRGYCEHYATASAVLFRAMGVPARYVSGYCVDPGRFRENADGTYSAVVVDSMAHAWSEVYGQEAGWLVADATPSDTSQNNVQDNAEEYQGYNELRENRAPEKAEKTAKPAPEKTKADKSRQQVKNKKDTSNKNKEQITGTAGAGKGASGDSQGRVVSKAAVTVLLVIVFMVIIVALWMLVRKRIRTKRMAKWNHSVRKQDWNQAIAAANEILALYLKTAGYKKEVKGDDEEYFSLLAKLTGSAAMVQDLRNSLEQAAYSPRPVTSQEAEIAAAVADSVSKTVWQQCSRSRKIYLRFVKDWKKVLTLGRSFT